MTRQSLIWVTTALSLAASVAFADDRPFAKERATVLGHEMAYVDEGTGQPVVFLHGNPTSSYLWRNIIPALPEGYRAIAPDLIGMGDSAQPALEYTYADQAAHLHGLLDQLDLDDVVLVIHDWGSTLGLDWARQNEDRVSAVVFMEAFVPPFSPAPSYEAMGGIADMFRLFNSDQGAQMVLEQNFFVEKVLGELAVRDRLSDEVLAEYRRPFPTPESRAPLLAWPRQVPIAGAPAQTAQIITETGDWLVGWDGPKLMFHVTPGALISPDTAAWLQENLTNLTAIDLGAGVHFIQETYPDEIGAGLAAWLGELPAEG